MMPSGVEHGITDDTVAKFGRADRDDALGR